jgi:uncharacterized protein YifE (UPF0438 family)
LLQRIKSLTDGLGLNFCFSIKEESILEHMLKITQSLELSKRNYDVCEERNMARAITSDTISVYNSGIFWPHEAVDSERQRWLQITIQIRQLLNNKTAAGLEIQVKEDTLFLHQ